MEQYTAWLKKLGKLPEAPGTNRNYWEQDEMNEHELPASLLEWEETEDTSGEPEPAKRDAGDFAKALKMRRGYR